MEINVVKDNLKIVPITQVKPNSWNPKNKNTPEYQDVIRSLKTYGQRTPIIVRQLAKDIYEIIDGEQRWTGMLELGFKKIAILIQDVDQKTAQELTAWFEHKVPFDDVMLSEWVKKLHDEFDEVILPFSDERIKELLDLSTFDWNEDDDNYSNPTNDNEQESLNEDDSEFRTLSVKMTKEQYEVIQRAIESINEDMGEYKVSEAKALELICADYMAGKLV